jgi:hypothetical protein
LNLDGGLVGEKHQCTTTPHCIQNSAVSLKLRSKLVNLYLRKVTFIREVGRTPSRYDGEKCDCMRSLASHGLTSNLNKGDQRSNWNTSQNHMCSIMCFLAMNRR